MIWLQLLLRHPGPRPAGTWHRLAVAVEDAGFELRDSIAWLYGSGFPKSLDVSKAIDKAAGAEREVIGERAKLQSYGATEAGDVNAVYGGGPDKAGVQLLEEWARECLRLLKPGGHLLAPGRRCCPPASPARSAATRNAPSSAPTTTPHARRTTSPAAP